MSNEVAMYQAGLKIIIGQMSVISMIDVPGNLREIERAHSLGPILNPTLYRDNAEKMEEDKQIWLAALPLWNLAQKMKGGE